MSAWLTGLNLKTKMGASSPPKVPEILRSSSISRSVEPEPGKEDEIKRNVFGTLFWVFSSFYFLNYPLTGMVLIATAPDALPPFYAAPEWTCWAGLGVMFLYGIIACLGCFRPFAKLVRYIIAGIFIVGLLFDVGLAVYTGIALEAFYMHSGINAFFLTLLGTGMLFGYKSVMARVLLPFRVARS